jgi:hypothetical protein
VVLFTALCILSAVRGGLLAFFIDVILVGAYGTAGNFAAPIIFLILLLPCRGRRRVEAADVPILIQNRSLGRRSTGCSACPFVAF